MKLGRLSFTFALALGVAAQSWALVPGGGPKKSDCYVEWLVTSPSVPPTKGTRVDCADGSACDADGKADGTCTIDVAVCAFQTDPNLTCTPNSLTAITGPTKAKVKPKSAAGSIVATLPTPPTAPISVATCGPSLEVKIPVGSGKKGAKITYTGLKATSSGKPKKDSDKLTLSCISGTGNGGPTIACPPNPVGADQPNEIVVNVAAAGTDLDNGRTGSSHNFPTPADTKFQLCLENCNKTDDHECEAYFKFGEGTFNKNTFGPPLPLFTAGIPVCVMNRYAATQARGTADLMTGAINGPIKLESDVFLTDETNVCPKCDNGKCNSGPNQGKACSIDGTVTVVEAATANKTFQLSKDCPPPTDLKAGTLNINLPLTTGTSTLSPLPGGSAQTPCVAQPGEPTGLAPQADSCPQPGGTCTAQCTGLACATMGTDYVTGATVCVDRKGGISQLCCSNSTTTPCFPTRSGAAITSTGKALVPQPAWPDPTYPKTTDCTPGNCTVQVATFCEAATGTGSVDGLAGLPGPGLLILPVTSTWKAPGTAATTTGTDQ
jgi:hypothetical protein